MGFDNSVIDGNLSRMRIRKGRENFTNGVFLTPWQNRRYADDKSGNFEVLSTELVTVLGRMTPNGRLMKGPREPIPLSRVTKPALSHDARSAIWGAYEWVTDAGGKRRLYLTGTRDGCFHLQIDVGFWLDGTGRPDGDINRVLLDHGELYVPGSFSLDGMSEKLAQAEGLELTEEKATRMKWSVGKSHPIIGAPAVRLDAWKIPKGAGVIVQDVDGSIMRFLHEKDGTVKIEPSPMYRNLFMDREMERRKKTVAGRKEQPKPAAGPTEQVVAEAPVTEHPVEGSKT